MKDIKPPLFVQVVEFSDGKALVTLIGEGYCGLWWEGEDGDWERGAAVDLNRLIGATVEQKEF